MDSQVCVWESSASRCRSLKGHSSSVSHLLVDSSKHTHTHTHAHTQRKVLIKYTHINTHTHTHRNAHTHIYITFFYICLFTTINIFIIYKKIILYIYILDNKNNS
eukprot:GHVR01148507.1.p1 GENE.GHVR01148507.1~~GHVR01148507.1.p1  ORF type:complete len:105 (-),score=46.35 GHVR01148507.1:320-634(-)